MTRVELQGSFAGKLWMTLKENTDGAIINTEDYKYPYLRKVVYRDGEVWEKKTIKEPDD